MPETQNRETPNMSFFRQWVCSPKEVGAILPSSSALAHTMAAQVPVIGNETVLELGAGMGAITKALLQAGVCPSRLIIMEKNPSMTNALRQRFPDLCILQKDVMRLTRAINEEAGTLAIKTIVSGLPMLLFDNRKQYAILRQVFSLLAYNGFLIQFTYGPMSPVSRQVLLRLGIQAKRVAFVWRNAPPAVVWKLELSPSVIAQ